MKLGPEVGDPILGVKHFEEIQRGILTVIGVDLEKKTMIMIETDIGVIIMNDLMSMMKREKEDMMTYVIVIGQGIDLQLEIEFVINIKVRTILHESVKGSVTTSGKGTGIWTRRYRGQTITINLLRGIKIVCLSWWKGAMYFDSGQLFAIIKFFYKMHEILYRF